MHRFSTAQGAIAILVVSALSFAVSCASAKLNNGNHSDDMSVGSGDDLGGNNTVDLLGLDLTGVDLTGFGGNSDMAGPPCNVVAQMGCGTGEKCTLTSDDGGTGCIADGTGVIGAICGTMGADDCLHGNICTEENSTGTVDQCRETCLKDGDCKQPAAGSVASNVGHCIITFANTDVGACTVACQPIGNTGCSTGLGCQVFGYSTNPDAGTNANAMLTDCVVVGAGTNGSSCTTNGNADCAAGYVCIDNGTNQKCRQSCNAGNSGNCSTGGYSCQEPTGVTNPPWGFCCPTAGC